MIHGLSKTQRLSIAIGISFSFFAAEISGSSISEGEKSSGRVTNSSAVGFYTHSLALVADAFHYVRFHQI
jgi:zinc transporter 1